MSGHEDGPLAAAKAALTIPEMAAKLGWDWKPGKSCRVPYRDDRAASGSVFKGGTLFHDFSSGETLDGPALLGRMCQLSQSDSAKLLIKLAGIHEGDWKGPLPAVKRARRKPEPPPRKPALPRLVSPGDDDVRALARLRGLSAGAVVEAARRGLLWTCRWRGEPSWALCDEDAWLCQMRRLDGQPYPRKDDGPAIKALTCGGSRAGWPVGVRSAVAFPRVVLCEGGPDVLAALHLARVAGVLAEVGVVGLLGASCRIVADALPLFRGKRVRLLPHADAPRPDGKAPGLEGAAKWQGQLDAAGAVVDVFDLGGFDDGAGKPLKDLNDLVRHWPRVVAEDPAMAGMFDF